MDLIIALIETRFWLGDTERRLGQLWPWEVVFGLPRDAHRQMVHRSDVQDLRKFKIRRGYVTWLCAVSNTYYENLPSSYKTLRETYFPKGIDDAIPSFIKQYNLAQNSACRLQSRCALLVNSGIKKEAPLVQRASKSASKLLSFLDRIMQLTQLWHADTKRQLEYRKLPGVTWDQYGPIYTPIRWTPGIPWLDWLCNVQQPRFHLERHTDYRKPGTEPHSTTPGAFEVRLCQSICPIWVHFGRMHNDAEDLG
ncbi:hypothetical protein BX600DRAFT_465472 [Xylariales sp. PMI_506]|nr:hypothetical protein BX600DRAFT_465472 [Xylariales sp. PMI_506]